MKKLLLAAVAGMLMMSACKGGIDCKQFGPPKNLIDSIAYFVGMNNGFKIAADLDSLPAEEKEAFDRDRFLEGLHNGIMTDTTRQSLLMGYSMVGLINGELSRYERYGVKLDRHVIVEAYREVLIDNKLDSLTIQNENAAISSFVDEIQKPEFDGKYDSATRSRQFGHSAAARFRQIMPSARTASGQPLNAADYMEGVATLLDIPDDDKGYAAGINLGTQLLSFVFENSQLGINIDRERIFYHFQEAFNSKRRLNKAEEILCRRQLEALVDRATEQSPIALANVEEGKNYIDSLAMNNPNLQITLSGLAYIITRQGSGAEINEKTDFQMTFEGRLVDGTVFDKIETPVKVSVNELIPGLREGVMLLRRGGEATFIIPGHLAYGVKGTGKIPPMATLVYTVKII